MKKQLTKKIINKYILNEFGNIPNIPNKDDMIDSINNNKLTLEKVKLWSLFGGDLMIKGNEYGKTILHVASYMGQLDIVEYVLDKGVDVDCLNDNNSTLLLCASESGHTNVINYLLDRGANINHQGKNKWSALHFACEWNKLETVKVLVNKKIDIQLKGNYYKKDETALDVAKHHNYQRIVDYLTPLYNN